jgi:hypothetical protein
MQDPEVLPDAVDTTARANPREGDDVEAPLDSTLSEEGEGDNISGNKELWASEPEDETISKRLKVPLHPPTTE